MATFNCKTFFVPQIIEVVDQLKAKADENGTDKDGNVNPMLATQKQMCEQMANIICKYVFETCANDKSLDDALAYEWKSAERCLDFVFSKAKELNIKGATCLWVPDSTVFGWIHEYYMKDDKAEYEEEKRKEEEARIKAEKDKEARALRAAKKKENDLKKAIKKEKLRRTFDSYFDCGQTFGLESLTKIKAEKYFGVNLAMDTEARAEVVRLALSAIEDKNKKITQTDLIGKFKLSKNVLAEIESSFVPEEPEDISDDDDLENEEFEDFEEEFEEDFAD